MGKCGVGGGAEKNMVWYRNRSGSIRGYALFVPGSGSFFIGLDAGFYGAAGSKMDGTQMEDPEGNRRRAGCCAVLENVTGISAEKSRNFLIYQAGLLAEQLQNRLGPACLGYLLTLVKGIIALGGGVLVVILFGTLVLKDMDQFRKWIRKSEAGRRIVRITEGLCRAGGRYLKAQLTIMLHPAVMLIFIYGGFFLYGLPGFFLGPFSVLVFQNVMKEVNCCMEKKRNAKG